MGDFLDIGSQLGLGAADAKSVVINLIRLALGLAPLVAVSMLILGGMMWMTSAGNEERLDRAKRTISGAVIGLILIMLAWAIVVFFAGTTANVTRPAS
jgi:cytochrome bd-type quinol oxidase subunit 2